MKRIFAIILSALIFVLSLCSCEETEPEVKKEILISPDEFMAQMEEKVVEFTPSLATEMDMSVDYGTIEKVSYYSETLEKDRNVNVLLPAGYTKKKKYPVLYVLHGYWGNEDSMVYGNDRTIENVGNGILAGEVKEMIVVFPYIYASKEQDEANAMDDYNNQAYDNFINDLVNDLMPFIEKEYSVATGRENTAITGFSMGGRESLYIGFTRPDLFGYVGAVCPAPGASPGLIAEDDFTFEDSEYQPWLLMITAGGNDGVVGTVPYGYNDILNNNGVTHIWQVIEHGGHDQSTVTPHMYNFLRMIFWAE